MNSMDLNGVPETMLQTLYARAAHSQTKKPRFVDAKAVELISMLNYDFSNAAHDSVMSSGVIARTILLDQMVGEFIRENPCGRVVNIACGLDTRFYRLDNGRIRWINLDLPETIDVRRRLLPEEGRVSTIACSAMDERWAREVGPFDGKTLVVIEGLLMYLMEADVRRILSIIERGFDDVVVIAETMSSFIMKHFREKSIEATGARFTWGVRSGADVAALSPGLRWVRDVSLVEGMKALYPVYRLIGGLVKGFSNQLVILQKCAR